MEERAKPDNDHRSLAWAEFEEKAKDDPEFAKRMEASKRVIERYSEALQRLAGS
ncbi:MAG: hypothetical protein ABSC48_07870 [Terracidiphilus sp.]